MNTLPYNVNSFVSLENDREDNVYAHYVPYTENVGSVRNKNDLYLNCDYKLTFISTIGPDIKVIHKRNIVSEIREDSSLKSLIGSYVKGLSGKGIYIIETYTLNVFNKDKLDKIINNLANADGVALTSDIIKDIYEQYSNKKPKYSLSIPINIRFISFVPEGPLREYGSLYVRQYDIVLTSNSYGALPEHPNSQFKINLSHKDRVNGIPSNVLTLDITDNESVLKETNGSNKKGTNYFMKIGNGVYRFVSTSDGVTPSGAVMAIKHQYSDLPEVINIDKADFEKYGLYKDRDLAIYNGDKKGLLEDRKLQLELDKISNDKAKLHREIKTLKDDRKSYKKELKLRNDKLNLERKKLEHELIKMEHELEKMRMDRQMLRKKAAMEIISNSFKLLSLEIDMSRDRQKFLLEQSRLDNKFKLDNSLLKAKFKLDSDLTKYKFNREDKLAEEKFIREDKIAKDKNRRENIKNTFDTVSKAVNTGINIGKEFL